MKLGIVAATVAAGALVVGGPAAVWVVSAHEYNGDDASGRDHDRGNVRVERHRGPWGPSDRWQLPGHPGLGDRPGVPIRPPSGDARERIEGMRELVEWSRCVLKEAREADGPVDLEKKCGEAPELEGPGGPLGIPEKPDHAQPDEDPDY